MTPETRQKFNAFAARVASMNGSETPKEQFAVTPTVGQTLEDRIVEQADFLAEINIMDVNEIVGEKLGIGVDNPIASRTDTSGSGERTAKEVHSLTDDQYQLHATEFDTAIKYNTLDSWAKFPDFEQRIRNAITKRIAMDRLMTGWNGTSAAATTDPGANPLRQDLNIGWLELIRTKAAEQMMPAGVKVGDMAGADYKNFDELVYDMTQSLLAEWYVEDTQIEVMTGRSLLTTKYLELIRDNNAPTEKAALKTLMVNKSVGGKQAKLVPYFPSRSLLITKPTNLSIYTQGSSRRRNIQDEPKKNRIADYLSWNEGYVVEDYQACGFISGILVPNADKSAWV